MGNCCNNRNFWRSAKNYAKAVIKWIRSGRLTRTESEIIERWEICQKCEHFRPIAGKPWRGRCANCGCYIGRHTHNFLPGNKIAMQTEQCPAKKWE